jgi:hypothetical protein
MRVIFELPHGGGAQSVEMPMPPRQGDTVQWEPREPGKRPAEYVAETVTWVIVPDWDKPADVRKYADVSVRLGHPA